MTTMRLPRFVADALAEHAREARVESWRVLLAWLRPGYVRLPNPIAPGVLERYPDLSPELGGEGALPPPRQVRRDQFVGRIRAGEIPLPDGWSRRGRNLYGRVGAMDDAFDAYEREEAAKMKVAAPKRGRKKK